MSGEIKMPAIHIPEEHRATAKEHDVDRALREAATEAAEHRWTPDPGTEQQDAMTGTGLALGMGGEGVAVGAKPRLSEFQRTYEENQVLARLEEHPRVAEALAKMEREKRELKGHELIEANCALRELTLAKEKKNRWDGQGRWMGHENEEMRYGKILTPQQFYDQLGKVTGKGWIKLSEHVVFEHPWSKSGVSGMMMRNPKWDGAAEIFREGERQQALKMADEAQKLWNEAQSLHRLGRIIEADKKVKDVSAMVAEAQTKFQRAAEASHAAEPEFLRVATMQWPLSTEWMIVEFTEWGTVWKPRFYGWRTALLTMIRNGAITETEAHQAFPLGHGDAGQWYLQQIYEFQNIERRQIQ